MLVLKGQGRTSPIEQWCDWVAERMELAKLKRNI
jgi:hypothetical protein